MSCDDEQFNFVFANSSTENSERTSASALLQRPSRRKAEDQAVEAKPNSASLHAATAWRPEADAVQRFLSVSEVALRYSVSVPTIWRWQKLGTFPHCYRIGGGTSRWALSELQAYDLQLSQGGR